MHFQKLLSLTLFIIPVALASPVEHAPTLAPLYIPPGPAHDLVDDSYIVMFHDDIHPSVFDAHISFLKLAKEWHSSSSTSITLRHVYNSEIAKGYSGKFTPDVLDVIRSRPEVKYIEQDSIVYAEAAADEIQTNPPWGLARINHEELTSQNRHYVYPRNSGAGVMVYVLDTGVYKEHNAFEGRVRLGENYFPDEGNVDLNGHGTHVAGTIASNLYGVAKKAEITSVKVLGRNKKGIKQDVIKALEWVLKDSKVLKDGGRQGQKGFVVNMSLGSRKCRTLENAVNNMVTAGLHVVVAAGNDNMDACEYSPAAAKLVITVGATTMKDERWSDSNHGKCVDVFAPGKQVNSCWIGEPDAHESISCTSMASPHVAGLVAHFLSIYQGTTFQPQLALPHVEPHYMLALVKAHKLLPNSFTALLTYISEIAYDTKVDDVSGGQSMALTPDQMKSALLGLALEGKISGRLPPGTPNKLAYNNYTHAEPSVWDEEPFLVQLNN